MSDEPRGVLVYRQDGDAQVVDAFPAADWWTVTKVADGACAGAWLDVETSDENGEELVWATYPPGTWTRVAVGKIEDEPEQ